MSEFEKTPEEIRETLACCTGTERYHQYMMGLVLTDGVATMANLCRAYWLIDIIASYQEYIPRQMEDFQLWKLLIEEKNKAIVACFEDSDRPPIIKQKIDYTNFPLPEGITLYVEGNVVLLPSEH